ncbi:MAG: hypothetical protein H7Y88_00240 [Phycisphaerales bacterium]|nr:hypothetical protein [Phycisphaerales bacterium]
MASPPVLPAPTVAPIPEPHVLSFEPPPSSASDPASVADTSPPSTGSLDPSARLATLSFRKGGSISLAQSVGIELGVAGFDPLIQGGLGSASLSGLSERGVAAGSVDVYDLSLDWRALRTGPLSFSVLGGVRALGYDVLTNPEGDGSRSRQSDFTPIPVAGGGIRWDVGSHVFIRGRGVGHANDEDGSFLDLSLETGIDITRLTQLSVGYQHLRAASARGPMDASVERDALLLQFRIRY